MMGKNQSVGKGHTKWLGGPACGPPVAHPCARQLFKGSNGSASLVDCTRKKFLVGGLQIFCD